MLSSRAVSILLGIVVVVCGVGLIGFLIPTDTNFPQYGNVTTPHEGGETTSVPVPTNQSKPFLQLLTGLSGSFALRSESSVSSSNNSSSTLLFESTLRFSAVSGLYGAVGFSQEGMDGRLVACGMGEGGNPTSALCILYTSYNYGVIPLHTVSLLSNHTTTTNTPASSAFRVISSGVVGTHRTISFEIEASLIGAVSGLQRAIFGYGLIDAQGMEGLWGQLQQLGGSRPTIVPLDAVIIKPMDRVGRHVFLSSTGTVLVSSTTHSDIQLAWVAVILSLSVLGICGHVYIRVVGPLAGTSPRSSRLLRGGAGALLLVGIPLALLILSHRHYVNKESAAPWFRATGEVAKYGFTLVFFPVCRRLSLPAAVFRTPRQHAISMHTLVGVLILVAVSVHGAGMAWKTAAAPSELVNPYTPRRNLFGVLAWVVLVIVAIPAMLRHSPLISNYLGRPVPGLFALFSATHTLVFVAVFCAIMHHGELIWLVLPGLAMYGVDRAWVSYNARCVNASSHIISGGFSSTAAVTALQISCADVCEERDCDAVVGAAGKHVLLTIPELGVLSHPFSIALVDPIENSITIFIQNTCAGDAVLKQDSTRWSERLAVRMSGAEVIHPSVQLTSLIREPSFVPLRALLDQSADHVDILLVAGGIGITPILSLLNALCALAAAASSSTDRDVPGGSLDQSYSLTVVWSVRQEGLREYFTQLLRRLVGGLGTVQLSSGDRRELYSSSLHIFSTTQREMTEHHGVWEEMEPCPAPPPTTTTDTNAVVYASPYIQQAPQSVFTMHRGRPTVAAMQMLVDDATAGVDTYLTGAVYGCGPPGLLEATQRVAENRHLKCHNQTFH